MTRNIVTQPRDYAIAHDSKAFPHNSIFDLDIYCNLVAISGSFDAQGCLDCPTLQIKIAIALF
ncbi:MAG: hypothetical protein WBM86_17800 [Waterburya sp.]